MSSLLLAVLLTCAAGGAFAVDVARCSYNNQSRLTLTPYEDDGVVGRYLAEMCLDLEPGAESWELSLSYYDNDSKCKRPPINRTHMRGKLHSKYVQTIKFDGNCSHVCLNATFDLVFSACYQIASSFKVNSYNRHLNHSYFNIENNYTKAFFARNQAVVSVIDYDENYSTIIWHTGVPYDDFEFSMCKILNKTAGTLEDECGLAQDTACVAASATELLCRAPLSLGCHELLLTLYAPWMNGVFHEQGLIKHGHCKVRASEVRAEGSSGAWAWAALALLVAAAAAIAAAAACRSRRARKVHKAVLKEWLVHRGEPAAAPAPKAARVVLLLYAREGPSGQRVADALRDMLCTAPNTQVLDVFSAEATAAAAAAPGAWLRALLARPDVAVVLLQTPALAALHQPLAEPAGGSVQLAAPLLGRRVAYRSPAFGDALLQMALRLAADAPHAADYRKYYVATLAELPTEAVPALVPFRRYALPGAGALLARDAAAAEPGAGACAELARAAAAFAAHASEHPHYLMDELVCM